MFEFKYSLFYFVFSAIWALYLLGSYNSNSLVQKLSRVLGFYGFAITSDPKLSITRITTLILTRALILNSLILVLLT